MLLHLFVCLITTVNVRGLSKRLGLHYVEVRSKEQAEKSFSFSFSSKVSLKSSKDTIKSLMLNYYIVLSLQINLWDTPCKSNSFNKHFILSKETWIIRNTKKGQIQFINYYLSKHTCSSQTLRKHAIYRDFLAVKNENFMRKNDTFDNLPQNIDCDRTDSTNTHNP